MKGWTGSAATRPPHKNTPVHVFAVDGGWTGDDRVGWTGSAATRPPHKNTRVMLMMIGVLTITSTQVNAYRSPWRTSEARVRESEGGRGRRARISTPSNGEGAQRPRPVKSTPAGRCPAPRPPHPVSAAQLPVHPIEFNKVESNTHRRTTTACRSRHTRRIAQWTRTRSRFPRRPKTCR